MDVLLVEDERLIGLMIARIFSDLGHRVLRCVHSGEDALEFVKSAAPDFILMDIMLEGPLDGIETARRIRETNPVPFAFASAYTDQDTRVRAAAVGPVDFLPKPIRPADIAALMDRLSSLSTN